MEQRKQYWPVAPIFSDGKGSLILEARAGLALMFIERFGVIGTKTEGEDTAGRAKLELQSPTELVERCFQMADAFIERAEQRGEIRSASEEVEKAKLASAKKRALSLRQEEK